MYPRPWSLAYNSLSSQPFIVLSSRFHKRKKNRKTKTGMLAYIPRLADWECWCVSLLWHFHSGTWGLYCNYTGRAAILRITVEIDFLQCTVVKADKDMHIKIWWNVLLWGKWCFCCNGHPRICPKTEPTLNLHLCIFALLIGI